MYVYIKFGNVVKIVSNVTIDSDRGPLVDGERILDSPRMEESNLSSKGSIDAISWFKSLPMEAVYIDCGVRDAKWCLKSVTVRESDDGRSSPHHSPVQLRRPPRNQPVEDGQPFMPKSARRLFTEHPGVLDFNPIIDEMFEQAEEIFCNWDALLDQGELNKQVAKLLHCYVFPAVVFQREDIPALVECKRLISVRQEAIEKDIVVYEKRVGVTEKYMNRQKEILLSDEGLTTQSYLRVCNKEFVETFYMHVTKDIQSKNMKLDILQLKINDLKKRSKDLQGPELERLAGLKKERDALHEVMEKLLSIREAVRNYLYRPFIHTKRKRRQSKAKVDDKMSLIQTAFLEAHRQLVQNKDELKRLCMRKLHTVAMREAIQSNIQSLQHQNPRSVGDFSEFSVYFGKGDSNEESRRKWRSMQARVDDWMSTSGKLRQFHLDGCQLIKDLADGILCDHQVPVMGLDTSLIEMEVMGGHCGSMEAELGSTTSLSGHNRSVPGIGGSGNDGEDSFTKRAPMVQVIRDNIVKHTWMMAQRIVDKMSFDLPSGTRHVNRAWVCYGPHFWKEVGPAVEKVYARFHAPEARQVHACTSSAAVADLMDSKMFLELFLMRKSSELHGSFENISEAEGRIPSVDAVSAVSLDLQRCSVKDLYALANRDGAKVMGQMVELESLKCSVSSLSVDSDPNNTESDTGVSTGTSSPLAAIQCQSRSSTSSNDSGDSIHSDDLFNLEQNQDPSDPQPASGNQSLTSNSSTASLVMTLFDALVEPYHEKVRQVLAAGDVMEKLKAVWQSLDFLSRKTGEVCKARGMDTLLPVSIFATASFSENLFVDYYVQLLILIDLRPSFAEHCMYDFSLTNAFSTFMYLFEARFNNSASSGNHS